MGRMRASMVSPWVVLGMLDPFLIVNMKILMGRWMRGAVAVVGLLLAMRALGQPSVTNSFAFANLDGATGYFTSPTNTFGGDLTVEGWVYLRSYNSWCRILDWSRGPSTDVVYLAASEGVSGRPQLSFWVGGAGYFVTAPSALPLYTWNHVAGTVSSDRTMRLYVNGLLVASTTAAALPTTTNRHLNYIGESHAVADGFLNGGVADVRVWDVARTQPEIQATMPVGSIRGPANGLVAAYPFGTTGATVLADVSGNGLNLTAVGTVRYETAWPSVPRASTNTDPVVVLSTSGSWARYSVPTVRLGGDVTLEGWVYQRSFASWARVTELANGAPNNNIILGSSHQTSGKAYFTYYFSGTSPSPVLLSPDALPLFSWTHLAGTVGTNGVMRLFVNGQAVASATISTANLPPTVDRSNNWIGNHNFGGAVGVDGVVEGAYTDVRIWDVERTQSEIQAGMAVGSISGPTTGLVAAYPFGSTGQSALTDVSGNGRTLTGSGDPFYLTVRPLTPALSTSTNAMAAQLDGAASFLSAPSATFGGDLTVEGWLYLRSYASWATLLDWGRGQPTDNVILATSGTSGRPNFSVVFGTTPVTTLTSPNALPLFTWNHVAGTVGSDRTMRLYVNGQVVATGTAAAVVPTLARNLNYLGKSHWDANALLNGSLADVRVWDVERTQAQIQAAMPVGSITGPVTGLVAAYPLGATGAAALEDVSGNSLHLAPTGTVTFTKQGAGSLASSAFGGSSMVLVSGGTLAVTGATNNPSTGVIVASGTTYAIGNGSTTGGSGIGPIANSGELLFNRSNDLLVTNVISGSGQVTQAGPGTTTLTAANLYTGTTFVRAGTLAVGASGTLGSSPTIVVGAGATLDASQRSSGLSLAANQSLTNAGGTGILRGNVSAAGAGLSMSWDGASPAFSVAGGTLTLSAATTLRLTTASAAPLPLGSYRVISKGVAGLVGGVAPATVTIPNGTAGNVAATAALVDGELFLSVGQPVAVQLGNLDQGYDGTSRAVTVTTTPAGTAVAVTYDGSTTPPVIPGTYAVVATVTAPGSYGSATGTLRVAVGQATIELGRLGQFFDGTAREVSVVTTPPGLTWTATYNGGATVPTNVGIYNVAVTVTQAYWTGSTNGVLVVRDANPGNLETATSDPPSYLTHHGFLADSDGTPLGSPNPRNYDLVFRVFEASSGGSALWAERQVVTVDQGRYAVMLGAGIRHGGEPWPPIDRVLASGPATARFLEVTIRGLGLGGSDVVMAPRFSLSSQPYAFLVRHADTAGALVSADEDRSPLLSLSGTSVAVGVAQAEAMLHVGGQWVMASLANEGNATVGGSFTATSFTGPGTIPMGGIIAWAGSTPPAGWALCDGRVVGSRRTPDLRGRFVLGTGQGIGLTLRTTGQVGGAEVHVVGLEHLPAHSHVFDAPPATTELAGAHSHTYQTYAVPRGLAMASFREARVGESRSEHAAREIGHNPHVHSVAASGISSEVGAGRPHNGMPPFYVLAYIMRVQ